MISSLFWIVPISALMALLFAWIFYKGMKVQEEGTDKMKEIAEYVREGAMAYLKSQYTVVGKIFIVLVVLLSILAYIGVQNPFVPVAFLTGGFFSGLCGYLGMKTATFASNRTAWAASKSLNKGLQVALRSGAVMGLVVVGFALLDIAAWFIFLTKVVFTPEHMAAGLNFLGLDFVTKGIDEHQKFVEITATMITFGMGASTQALFARVGGGIFTKAADVGADLVGKVEEGIPEDDPRNAATIADNTGGHPGGWGGGGGGPLVSSAAVIGIFLVEPRKGDRSGMTAINRGFFVSAIISLVLVIGAAFWYLPDSFAKLTGVTETTVLHHVGNPRLLAIGAVIIGIVLASAIQLLTGYFTEVNRKPVRDIGQSSETGAATVILSGISTGMESAVYAALLIGGAVFGAFLLAYNNPQIAFFAVALTGTGLLTTVGVIVTMDSFGPVTDNAQGIAEMSGDVEGEGARVLTQLDAIGNTTKAITKGIAIATAVLTATALFGAFDTTVKDKLSAAAASTFNLSVDRPNVLVGVIIGASVVFMFAGQLILSVG